MPRIVRTMVAEKLTGDWGAARKTRAQDRIAALEDKYFTAAEREDAATAVFACLHRHMTQARIAVRAPDRSAAKGWSYQWIDDGAVQLTAARLMAQMLHLMPTAGGVTVDARTQTVNVTATERLAELDSLGVPREMVARACEDLLKVAGGGTGAESGKEV